MAKAGKGRAKPADGAAAPARIASNRRARRDYEVLETCEAGIALLGSEVKSLRAGQVALGDAFAALRRGELWLLNLHIGAYEQAGRSAPEPLRERKLLLHRREIARLSRRVAEKGFTLVPLSLYWKQGRAKVELGLCRGRRRYDKRQVIRKREDQRNLARALRRGRRG